MGSTAATLAAAHLRHKPQPPGGPEPSHQQGAAAVAAHPRQRVGLPPAHRAAPCCCLLGPAGLPGSQRRGQPLLQSHQRDSNPEQRQQERPALPSCPAAAASAAGGLASSLRLDQV